MKEKELIRSLDEARIVDAIRKAEQSTTGEIRVCVARNPEPDPMAAARRAFIELEMEKTRDRNAILILMAPRSQTLAILGDEGIHQKAGAMFWEGLVRELGEATARGEATEGVVRVIERLGEELARHFPRDGDDPNELPDHIATV